MEMMEVDPPVTVLSPNKTDIVSEDEYHNASETVAGGDTFKSGPVDSDGFEDLQAELGNKQNKAASNAAGSGPANSYATPKQTGSISLTGDFTKTITRPNNKMAPKVDISPIRTDDPTASPKESLNTSNDLRRVRARQQTVTVESQIASEIKKVFEEVKCFLKQSYTNSASGMDGSSNNAELERRILAVVQLKEKEWNGKLLKLSQELENKSKSCGKSIGDTVNHEIDLLVYRELVTEYEMMLRELTSGEYIHVTRVPGGGCYSGMGGCDGNCETVRAVCRLKFKRFFLTLFEYSALESKYRDQVKDAADIRGKFARLKESATQQLERASQDMDDCARMFEEKTVGLRAKVRQLEIALNSKEQELEIKIKANAELRDICDTLMRQVEPGSDVESDRG
uniref:TACC_C domain-containing protein n=1 Tax=Heterorhabditis bacteriophora TaxID=37862 RepID=A0A1I7XGD4_HETBA